MAHHAPKRCPPRFASHLGDWAMEHHGAHAAGRAGLLAAAILWLFTAQSAPSFSPVARVPSRAMPPPTVPAVTPGSDPARRPLNLRRTRPAPSSRPSAADPASAPSRMQPTADGCSHAWRTTLVTGNWTGWTATFFRERSGRAAHELSRCALDRPPVSEGCVDTSRPERDRCGVRPDAASQHVDRSVNDRAAPIDEREPDG